VRPGIPDRWAAASAICQRVIGELYGDALDEQDSRWLEEWYKHVSAACGLDL
jgi:hypothetical protein